MTIKVDSPEETRKKGILVPCRELCFSRKQAPSFHHTRKAHFHKQP